MLPNPQVAGLAKGIPSPGNSLRRSRTPSYPSSRQSRRFAPHEGAPERRDSPEPSQRGSKRRSSTPITPATAEFASPLHTATTSTTSEPRRRNSIDGSKEVIPGSRHSLPQYNSQRATCQFYYRMDGPREDRQVLIDEVKQDPKFKPEGFVASGGRSSVCYATFEREDGEHEWLAVKLIPLQRLNEDEIMAEFNILRSLRHSHIIAVVGAFKLIGQPEYGYPPQIGILLYPLASRTLLSRITHFSQHNERQILAAEVWRISGKAHKMLSYFACLCNAVNYLHTQEKPIKHKDIKPANILIDRDDTVILADFDRASTYSNNEDVISHGPTASTDRYAPESVMDNDATRGFDRDINCLGFVFLEMATVLFGETNDNLEAHLKRGVGKPPSPAYRHALTNGSIKGWIEHLRHLSTSFPERLILDCSRDGGPSQVDKFLDMILEMMEAGIEQQGLLTKAWSVFSRLCKEACEHCSPLEIHHAFTSGSSQRLSINGHSRMTMVPARSSIDHHVRNSSDALGVIPMSNFPPDGCISPEHHIADHGSENALPRAMGELNSDASEIPTISISTLQVQSPDKAEDPAKFMAGIAIENPATPPYAVSGLPHRSRSGSNGMSLPSSRHLSAISEIRTDTSSPDPMHDISMRTEDMTTPTGRSIDFYRPQGPQTRLIRAYIGPGRQRRRTSRPGEDATMSPNVVGEVDGTFLCVWFPFCEISYVIRKGAIKKDWQGRIVKVPRGSGACFRLPHNNDVVNLTKCLSRRATCLRKLGIVRSLFIVSPPSI